MDSYATNELTTLQDEVRILMAQRASLHLEIGDMMGEKARLPQALEEVAHADSLRMVMEIATAALKQAPPPTGVWCKLQGCPIPAGVRAVIVMDDWHQALENLRVAAETVSANYETLDLGGENGDAEAADQCELVDDWLGPLWGALVEIRKLRGEAE